jgi:MoaA/NifB/PqqE/SkfB family radical SAM enzyme
MKSDFENEKVNIILQDFIRPALKNCKSIVLDGCGEFLASKSWERFLKTISKAEFPSLELIFFTNGQLFTPERWEKFSNLKGMPISVGLSIDAASKDVYEELRRGGKWETLCRNMEYISSLKASGDVVNVTMRFVVQKKNIHQLEDFVLLGKKWNVDTIRFQRLGNYGTFSESEYFDSNVFSQDNPLRAEAVRIMTKLTRDKYEGIKIYEEGCLV